MKRLLFIFLAAVVAMTSGCLTTDALRKEIEEKERQYLVSKLELDERSRQLTSAIKDISLSIPEEEKRASDELIIILATEDERIEGLPIERINVASILQDFENKKPEINAYIDENTVFLKDVRSLEAELPMLKNHENTRPVKEKSKIKTFFAWLFGLGIPTIIGLIVLCALFPTIGVPIVTRIIERITSVIPALINILGITGKNVLDKVIIGVERAKQSINKEPDDKTFTKKEVEEIFKKHLKDASDDNTDIIVRHRKSYLKSQNKL